MGFSEDMAAIKANKKVLFLLGGGGLLLLIMLLLPAGERREPELPPGFERDALPQAPPPAPLAPAPRPVEENEEPPLSPQVLEEARRRSTQSWGADPFVITEVAPEAEAGPVQLNLQAIFFLGEERRALINGKILLPGDRVAGYEVTDIAEGVVTLEKEGLTRSLFFGERD